MGWRNFTASWFATSGDAEAEGVSSNMKLMVIAAAFLLVTIGLIVMQPARGPSQHATLGEPIIAPTAALIDETAQASGYDAPSPDQDVTRASTSLLSVNQTGAIEDVSKMLRQPIRLNGQRNDLRQLAKTALQGFGHITVPNDKLYSLLVQALAEGQSNAYIDALLNTAAGRGEFTVPVALQSASGRLDTDTLLQALASLVIGLGPLLR
jgi:hypothetical protein